MIKESKSNNINPDLYLDLDKANMEKFLSDLKEDNNIISTNVEEIKNELKGVKKDTTLIHKKTYFILVGILFIIVIAGSILYLVSNQSNSTNQISKDIEKIVGLRADSFNYKFIKSVMDLYGNDYEKYRASEQYKNDLNDFNKEFYELRYSEGNLLNEESQDSLKLRSTLFISKWKRKLEKSEFYYYTLASEHYINGNRIEALNCIDTAIVLNPHFAPIYFRKALSYENIDSTICYLSKAIYYDKEMGFIYLPYRSIAYCDKQDYSNSLSDINLYLDKYPSNRKRNLRRKLFQIAVLIDGGSKSEGCNEFSNLSNTEKENIKTLALDTYKTLKENCQNN